MIKSFHIVGFAGAYLSMIRSVSQWIEWHSDTAHFTIRPPPSITQYQLLTFQCELSNAGKTLWATGYSPVHRPTSASRSSTLIVGLARTVYMHRTWPFKLSNAGKTLWATGYSPVHRPTSASRSSTLFVGLTRTVYMHRTWPFIRWFPCQKHRIYRALANPGYIRYFWQKNTIISWVVLIRSCCVYILLKK